MIIGNKKINPPIIVAPMAGITDYPYRQILREMGVKLIYSEMVSSKGLVYDSERTKELLDYKIRDNGYINIQIFGSDKEYIIKAAKIIEKDYKPDFLDLNIGCPAPKVVKNGSGAALMKKPKILEQILKGLKKELNTPITIKIRSGWDKNHINAVQIAQIAEKTKISAVVIHGRSREQFYSNTVNYEVIKEVKDSVKIPVIGNGDIVDIKSALKMYEKTNCDGIMIGRGIKGNPWLVKRLIKYFDDRIYLPKPSVEQKIEMAVYHLEKAIEYYGKEIAVPKMRKHISWYLKGLKNSTYVKDHINKLNDVMKIKSTLYQYKKDLK
ncbi:MAG: tRNA dihydrouridine synthase DusB [Halanaerobiales bacterium]|nr:tRNA dihydrouridine synthase DusB [Halanaerobiales bacterium]